MSVMLSRFALAVVCGAVFVAPTIAADPELSCGELPCRANGLPYFSPYGGIVIMRGEAFSIELKIEGDKVVGIVPREGRGLPNTIEIEFNAVRGGRALVSGNHLDRAVIFEAYVAVPHGETLPTRACPLPPGRFGYETWSGEFELLELRAFRFTAADEAGCS